jgi:hypothetical protein
MLKEAIFRFGRMTRWGCGNPDLSKPTLPFSDLLQNDANTSFSSIGNHC